MGVFEDFSNFLESRLEEFLQANPHFELQALADKLQDQEAEAVRLLGNLRLREKQLQDEILATAQEVQRWHVRIEKAKNANRLDLLKPAEEREAALLRQGNQLWGQMELVKERIKQTIELQGQIKVRRQEVKVKLAEAEAAVRANNQTEQRWQTIGWNQTSSTPTGAADSLEQSFRNWEMEEELEALKRQMGR